MRRSLLLGVCGVLAMAGCSSRPKPVVTPESTIGSHLDLSESKADKATEAARIHTELGQQYMQNGNDKDALEKLQKALQFSDRYAPAHTVIAVLYEKIGDPANAELHYRRAEQLDPKAGATNNNLGVFLCKQDKAAEAQGYFDRAVADPFYATPETALANAGTCQLKAGQLDSAEIDFRKSLSRNPRNGEALYQLAHVLYLKNDAFRARAFLQRYEAFGQPSPDALKLGHDIELKLGNGPGAQDYAQRLRSQFPDSDSTHALDATASQ
jgi:type IV pilus assembly protein PilF